MLRFPVPPSDRRLTRGERLAMAAFAAGVVLFGVLVEVRSAFQIQRKTDFGVYARSAWAVRAGADLYGVADDRGWHYCYPPPFAVLMAPFADPPAGADRTGFLPFAASVAVWYLFSVGCLAFAVHAFAGAVLPDAVRGSRRWWYARTVPVFVTAGAIGATLSRGQVNLLVVAFVAALFAAAVRGKRAAAGAWLAAAVCLKVIPGLLVLFPVVRREWRAAGGLAVGLFVGLFAIPAVVWGVGGAVDLNLTMVKVVLRPGATGGGDQTRAKELTGAGATDSQSFQAAFHALRHPDPARRPGDVEPVVRQAHLLATVVLLAATVFAGTRAGPDPADQLVFLGGLCVVMVLGSPVSHSHYFVLVLPLVCGLWLGGLADRPGRVSAGPRTLAVLVAWGVLTAVPLFPDRFSTALREAGFGAFATVALWAFAMTRLGRPSGAAVPVREFVAPVRRSAA